MKDTKSLLLLLLSIGMVSTWIYHLYDKNQAQAKANSVVIKDTSGIAAIKDSLQQYYASTITGIDDKVDSARTDMDSLRGQLGTRLTEIANLRTQINGILKNRKATKAELDEAKDKITDLRTKLEEMSAQNASMDIDRKKLSAALDDLNVQVKSLEQNISKLNTQNQELNEIVTTASTFSASELTFSIIDVTASPYKETETNKAAKANKIVISFLAQNAIAQSKTAEIYVVVTDPEGKVLINSVWSSGNFDTKNNGTKTFTRKLSFEYEKNEQKRLVFSLEYDSFIKGTYNMQIYHNGVLIGATAKTLS